MTKWALPEDDKFVALAEHVERLEKYIEQLEQTIKNMTAHIRIDPDE